VARATIAGVAALAQVSPQTVSNVLNAPNRVRPATRERVQAAIEHLHFRPHHAARTLRSRRSRLLGVRLAPPTGDATASLLLDRFLHALTQEAGDRGYRVLTFTADGDEQETQAYDALLSDHDVDAFVLSGTHHGDARTAWLVERGVPFVTFGRPWGEHAQRHCWVDVDGAAGVRQAVAALVDAGHRRIGWVGWPSGSGAGDDRRAGWLGGLHDAGLSPASPGCGEAAAPDDLGAAGTAVSRLLEDPCPPSALVCASDTLALAAWTRLRRRDAPEPLALVGFDSSPTATALGFSSVAQPLAEVAAACLDVLIALLADATTLPPPVLLAPHLVSRAPLPTHPAPPTTTPPIPPIPLGDQ